VSGGAGSQTVWEVEVRWPEKASESGVVMIVEQKPFTIGRNLRGVNGHVALLADASG